MPTAADETDGAAAPCGEPGLVRLWQLLLLGLVSRVVGLAAFGNLDFPDARAYREMGRELVTIGQSADFRYMPLYPLWTQLTGEGLGQKVGDVLLSVLLIWVIHELGLVLFRDRRAALLAAAIAALYPHFIFYAAVGLTETAFTVLFCGAVLALYRAQYPLGALLLVLAILIRPVIDLLAPVLVVVFALVVHRRTIGFAIRRLVLYVALYVVLMLPWWVHNYIAYDTFVRLDLGDGVVLYAGNNPRNQTGGGILGVDHDPDDLDLAGLDPVARNAALRDAAISYIADHPGRFLEMAGIKFVRFWRLWPYAPEFQRPIIILASILSYGSVLVLSIWFLIGHARGRWRRLSPILLFVAFLTMVHVVTIASIRYRFPIEPFLIVAAGMVLSIWSHRWRRLDLVVGRFLGG